MVALPSKNAIIARFMLQANGRSKVLESRGPLRTACAVANKTDNSNMRHDHCIPVFEGRELGRNTKECCWNSANIRCTDFKSPLQTAPLPFWFVVRVIEGVHPTMVLQMFNKFSSKRVSHQQFHSSEFVSGFTSNTYSIGKSTGTPAPSKPKAAKKPDCW